MMTEIKFSFPKIEINLDVKDQETMMMHHTWIWNFVNITEQPQGEKFYYLEGDVPMDFSDLNVLVKDEDDRKLEIINVVNKPLTKEFSVKMNKPLKPSERGFLKLEYDWQEPERSFFYTFSGNCEQFKFVFTIPKGMEIAPKMFTIDSTRRVKSPEFPPVEDKHVENKKVVWWECFDLKAHSICKVEW